MGSSCEKDHTSDEAEEKMAHEIFDGDVTPADLVRYIEGPPQEFVNRLENGLRAILRGDTHPQVLRGRIKQERERNNDTDRNS